MELNKDKNSEFIKAFEEEHGVLLNFEDAKLALQNLTDFFALLYQYDLEDKQKDDELNKNQN